MDKKFENILLVSGNGRDVGKTTFLQNIISQHKTREIVAVKISPHFHEPTPGLQILESGEGWKIFIETDTNASKDTSLFLSSGAVNSFFIQSEKAKIGDAFNTIINVIPNDKPVVIESAGLRDFIKPGLYVKIFSMEDDIGQEFKEELMKTDLIVLSDKRQFFPDPSKINFNNGWNIKTEI